MSVARPILSYLDYWSPRPGQALRAAARAALANISLVETERLTGSGYAERLRTARFTVSPPGNGGN